jgi:hypothetical protein
MSRPPILIRAAELLDELAELERESCQITNAHGTHDWVCNDCRGKASCATRARYNELRAVARQLREIPE